MKPKSTRAAAGMALGLLAALLGLGMAPPATAADAGMPGVCGRPDSLSGESLRFCAVHDASPAEVSCHSLKLRAVGQYYGCLLRATDDEARQARCDDQFARAFAHADRISPGCEPLDDLDRTQRGVQHQAREVLRGDVSPPPCAAVVVQDDRVTCELSIHDSSTSVSSVSLSGILDQLQGMSPTDCPPCAQITAQTVLWLQAWGGDGGQSGYEGEGGFAQTITAIQDLRDQGVDELFFYLGSHGTRKGASGGQGGAATIVTLQDLTEEPDTEPELGQILLIAGAGGGGGGRDSACVIPTANPHSGGRGGVAISTLSAEAAAKAPTAAAGERASARASAGPVKRAATPPSRAKTGLAAAAGRLERALATIPRRPIPSG